MRCSQDHAPRRTDSGQGPDDPTTFPGSLSERERRISSSFDRVDRRPSTMIDLPPGGRPSISLHFDSNGSVHTVNSVKSGDYHNSNHAGMRGNGIDSPTSPLSPTTTTSDSQYPHPPSNEAIEQIIANAMALAGSGPPSKANSNSGSSSTPAPGGIHQHQHHQHSQLSSQSQPHGHQYPTQHGVGPLSQALPPALPRSDGSFGSTNGGTRPEANGPGEMGRPGSGLRTGSDGYLGTTGTGMGYSGQLAPSGGNVGTGGQGVGGRLGGTIGTFRTSLQFVTWFCYSRHRADPENITLFL